VGANTSVVIGANQTLSVSGAMTMGTGAALTFAYAFGNTTTLALAGTLTATGDAIQAASLGSNTTQIQVGSGGRIQATNTTFSLTQMVYGSGSVLNAGDLSGDTFGLTLYVPYGDVANLGGNASFQGVYIEPGTEVGGTLNLNQIGANPTNLQYVFYQGFTVGAGATLAVGPDVVVVIGANQTLLDNGTMTLTPGDTLTFAYAFGNTTTLAVGGSLSAIAATFQAGATSSNTTQVVVNSGGSLSLSALAYGLTYLSLNSGSNDTMRSVVMSSTLNINSGAVINITGNDFSNVPNKGVVAAGDANAHINLEGNYWGSTVIATIAAKIVDHSTNANLPTIDYQPFISGASGTSASPATTTFSPNSQTINLSATVSTTAGVAINEGTETFTILNGTQVIGQTTAPANVSNGAVTATYTLPAGTAPGQYIIEASYSGSSNYLPATDFGHLLTVNPAATITTTTNASATFNSASNQSINLSAQVNSAAGPVNEGIVTFTVYSGGNPVGSPVIANVSANAASATYTLLAKTPGGSYTIQAVYTDPIDFKTSTGTNTLTVAAAPTTLTTSNVAAAFSSVGGEGISLSANVSSSAGTVNEGTVAFTITDSSSKQVVPPIYVSVANGVASTNYLLPAGTAPGTYNLQVVYNGTASYAASLPMTATLTIGAATTTTTASTVTAAAGASPTLIATVTSPGGTVNTGMVTFTVLNNGTTIGTPQSANVSNGTASVSYAIPGNTAVGTYTIQAVYGATTDFGTSSDSTHSLVVTPPGAAKLFIKTEPVSSATAGTPFATTSQPVVVYEEDANGNLEASDNSTVITATVGSGPGSLTGTTTVTVVGGVATFTNLGDNAAGTITLTFSSGNLATVTSSTITISAGAAAKLLVSQQPSSTATAGQVFGTQPVVEVVDQYGNPVAGDSTDTVTAARGDLGTSTLLGNQLTVTLVNGVATFSGLSYNKAESMDITFTSSAGLSPVTSSPVQVGPTTASQLVIQQQPSRTATAGQPFPTQPVIYEEDQFGNLETGDNTTQVTAILGGGTGPLQGATTVTLSGGAARFSNLSDPTAETITLAFSGGGFITPAPSNPIVVGPAAAGKLVIQTQPSATATAGKPFTNQPVLYLEDANGNLETGDNTTQVTVSLASGAGAIQGTTTVTVKGGIATFTDLFDTKAGPITLGFSASDGLTAGPSNSILINPDVASQLVITTQPSATATAGQVFTTQPVVAEEDQYGNIETGDSSTVVTVALASGTGPLQGAPSVTLNNGVATFTGLLDKTAETITLQFSGGGLTSAPSGPIVVSSAAAAGLKILIQPYSNVTAGSPLTDPIDVAVVDQYGNVVSSDNTTQVTASLASGAGTLKGTTTATVHNGVASFDDLEDDKAGTLTLQFTAGTLPPVVSNPSTVSPGPAASLGIVVNRPPGGIPAGTKFTTNVMAFDAYGNVATSFSGPVTVSLASGSAGTLDGTLTQTASAGVATFTDLSDTTSGSITLNASSGSLTSTPSSDATATVNPGVPAKLAIQTQPPSTATAGQPFVTTAQPVVVSEQDQYGNLEAGDNSTVVTAFLGSGAGPLQGTLTATLAGGVATFTNLADNAAGTITLQFTGGGVTSAPSVPIVVSPAAASQLVITQQPSSGTAGQPFASSSRPVVVSEKDQFGNVETNDNTTMVSAALASGTGPLQGTTSVTMQGGIATFTDLEDDTAETITLNFAGGGFTAGPSGPIVIGPGAAASLVIQGQPSQDATAGTPFASTPVVYEKDRYGNVETTDNSTAVTAFLASGSGTLGGATSVVLKNGVASFTTLAEDAIGTFTLGFTGGGLSTPASLPITVSIGAPAKLVVQTQPSSTATAGQPFATQPVVYVEDAGGNLETSDNSTVVTVALAGRAGPLQGTTTATAKGGVATFTDLGENVAGTIVLQFSGGGLAPGASNPIDVSATTATKLVVTTPPPSSLTAGQPFTMVVSAEDPYGNVATSFNGGVTISLPGQPGTTTTVQAKNGVATFSGLTLDTTAQGGSIQAAGGGLTAASTGPVNVTPPNSPLPTPSATPPTITGEHVLMSRKTNKKGKPVGKSVLQGFELDFSTAMNPGTAGSSANYRVAALPARHGKKKSAAALIPVAITSSYDPVKHSVTLTLAGKQTFAQGGQIQVSYGAVTSDQGVTLDPSDAKFTILPKATGVTPS
jgi:hypothetical protein